MLFQCFLLAITGWLPSLPSLYIKLELLMVTIHCILGKTIKMKVDKNSNSAIRCKIKLRWLVGLTTFTVNDGGGKEA